MEGAMLFIGVALTFTVGASAWAICSRLEDIKVLLVAANKPILRELTEDLKRLVADIDAINPPEDET